MLTYARPIFLFRLCMDTEQKLTPINLVPNSGQCEAVCPSKHWRAISLSFPCPRDARRRRPPPVNREHMRGKVFDRPVSQLFEAGRTKRGQTYSRLVLFVPKSKQGSGRGVEKKFTARLVRNRISGVILRPSPRDHQVWSTNTGTAHISCPCSTNDP